ncbi:MAG: BON domain-containing protein [Gammaproteobacteria bacterium]|nr:BON domain-containing protein [Gammaproteobacteria bacterium]
MNTKLLKIVLFLGLLSMLGGCVGGAVVAGAVGGASVGVDPRNAEVMLDDERIELTAARRIGQTPGLDKTTNISATSFNHVVLLTGQATTSEARTTAIDVVRHVDKVRKVHNAITVGPASTVQSRLNDAGLTTKVKLALLSSKGFSAANAKIVTESKVVYLMGIVSHAMAKAIHDTVQQVEGVDRAVDVFEYTD